ncbi:MAG: hypothetical protein ABI548_02780 [Polyangiaceae bacterium]
MKFVDFCARVVGIELTPAQRVLASVAFDGMEPHELIGADRDIAAELFGPIDAIPPEARAVLVALCGGRGGKSRVLCGVYSLWRALLADLSGLAPGEQAVALIVAPDMRLAKQTLRFALGAAKHAPSIAALIESENTEGFVLRRPDGRPVAVEALPATRGGSALRGRSLVSAVLDECAFFRSEEYAVNDAEIFRAVAPRVIDGGLVVIASTPWAEAGLLFDEFMRNHGHPVTAMAAHAPTTLLNPAKAAEVARERARSPENAAREFDAQFMSIGSGLFFDSSALDRALRLGLDVSEEPSKRIATIGGDLALVRDSSAFVAIEEDGDFLDVTDVLERRPERGAPLKLSAVCAEAAVFAKTHHAQLIWVDGHVLQPAREHVPEGFTLEAVEGGPNGKIERYVTVRNLLNEGRLRIPPRFQRLVNQLREVVSKPTSGGGLQITLPRRAGAHGDVASAFVLAAHAASQGACGRSYIDQDDMIEDFAFAENRWGGMHGRGFG